VTDIARNNAYDTDDGTGWTITSPMRLDQFTYELQEAASLADPPSISADGVTVEAAADNAVDLTISPAIADQTVIDTATAHVPNAGWTAPGQQAITPADVRAILAGGGTLTPEQISVALSDLYSRFDSMNTAVVTLQGNQQTSTG